ncbi:MAG TPA: DUF6644 family protein [Candidatus Dormibacteraeota bacterium]|nr:DUF6644 family protein [Candidatus Dormibacteraeota bacterium]
MNQSQLGVYMRDSLYAFPIVETLHIFGIVLLLSSAFLLDLRLFGVGPMRDEPVKKLARWILPWVWAGFTVQLISGSLMYAAEATRAALNLLFWLKMIMIVLAGVNALIFHTVMYKSVDEWNEARVAPLGARVYGCFSILIWFSVVGLGRWFSFFLS